MPHHYISADLATLQDLNRLKQQWEIARLKCESGQKALLIIDEVQKIPQWLDLVKKLFDKDTRSGIGLYVVILGSYHWLMQKGLTESLAGRFEIIHITHWSFSEMHKAFGWSVEEFIY